MPKIRYITLIVLISLIACQDIPTLVNDIAEENRVECTHVGFIGSSSSIYKKFEIIKNKATKEELYILLKHDSTAVICYASFALMDKKFVEPSVLFEKFLNHDKKVSTFCGCIMMSETLSSLIYNRYMEDRVEYLDDDYDNYKIHDTEELQKMDSLILQMRNPDPVLVSKALENRNSRKLQQ